MRKATITIERQQAVSTFALARSAAHAESAGQSDANRISVEPLSTGREPDQTQWSASRIRAHAALAELAPLPATLLRIRRVRLEVPVYVDTSERNTSERNLNRGAGLIAGTAAPDTDGNIAIAAHRDGYFRAPERARAATRSACTTV
jgi:sortase A